RAAFEASLVSHFGESTVATAALQAGFIREMGTGETTIPELGEAWVAGRVSESQIAATYGPSTMPEILRYCDSYGCGGVRYSMGPTGSPVPLSDTPMPGVSMGPYDPTADTVRYVPPEPSSWDKFVGWWQTPVEGMSAYGVIESIDLKKVFTGQPGGVKTGYLLDPVSGLPTVEPVSRLGVATAAAAPFLLLGAAALAPVTVPLVAKIGLTTAGISTLAALGYGLSEGRPEETWDQASKRMYQ
ncbi:unnamed protein product, partial [marine sediment metagenome]